MEMNTKPMSKSLSTSFVDIEVKNIFSQNKAAVKTLSDDIHKKYIYHQKKFFQFRNINQIVVIATSILSSMGISSLGIHLVGEGEIPAIIAMTLNSISFIISSVALAFQLTNKISREKILGSQYHDLFRDLNKMLLLNSDKDFDLNMTAILLDSTIEKLELIEDNESSI